MDELQSTRIDVEDDGVALYELSLRDGWGDGLPVLPPTEARVRALLGATPHDPSHVVAVLPPQRGAATVEKIAVNAAIAGVDPAAFPYVIAAIEAVSAPDHNLYGLVTTTSGATPVLIVNGPQRVALGFDHDAGCLGGASGRGSMTVGRAVQLCLRNIGGQRAGTSSKTVFGHPARITGMCFGEWEERSPWPSLASRRGYADNDDVVTVHAAKGIHAFADGNTSDTRDLVALIAKTLAFPLGNAFHGPPGRGQTVLLVNPMWATRFATEFASLDDLQTCLHEHAWQPIEVWPPANRTMLQDKARVAPGGRVMMHASPEQFVIVVCGGLGNLQAVALPTWGDSTMQSARIDRVGTAV
ncbi:MAG TPA: hypothetical protein VGQ20_01380 [Acidimicrobiales bacterium]|nr:hypothetical protein [Acidimicrobiales bacterium]